MSRAEPIVLAHKPPFRLGSTEVRPALREVIGPGGREVIEPRVMQVLVALAEAGGEILSRDDLIQSCWDGRIVGEDAINRVISRVRRVGEAVAAGSFQVETITKVGYRLVVATGAAPAIPSQAGAADGRPPGISRRVAVGAGLGIAAAGTTAILFLTGRREAAPPPAAAQLYAQANQIVRSGSPEQTAQAIGFLREAVDLAPDFADAWGLLAIAYRLNLDYEPPQAAAATMERARGAARRALEIDAGNANALAAEALGIDIYRNWTRAEAAVRRVLAIDPDQLDMRFHYAGLLAAVGRVRESIELIGGANSPFLMMPYVQFVLALSLWSAGRLDESDRTIDRAMALWPRHYAVWFTRFWLYAYTGRARQALAMSASAATRPPGIPDGDFTIIEACAQALATGAQADIETAIGINRQAAPRGRGYCQNAVQVASALGRPDEALALAEAFFFDRGFTIAPTLFTSQQGLYARSTGRLTDFLFRPSCRSLRAMPEFRRLTEEIGLADYWRRSGTRPDVPA